MQSKELIAYDALNGIAQYHHYDSDTGDSTFESIGDAGPVLEQNKVLANEPEVWKRGVKQEFVLYASIPTILQMKWLVEEGIDVYKKEHAHRVSKKLEDPEYRYLKCTTHRHLMLAHD